MTNYVVCPINETHTLSVTNNVMRCLGGCTTEQLMAWLEAKTGGKCPCCDGKLDIHVA